MKNGFVIANDREEYLAETTIQNHRFAVTRWTQDVALAKVYRSLNHAYKVIHRLASPYQLYALQLIELDDVYMVRSDQKTRPSWLTHQ